MSQLYYTTCNPIIVGCQLFLDSGITITAPAGFYSNGNDCYVCDTSGFVTNISTCPTPTPTPTPEPTPTSPTTYCCSAGGVFSTLQECENNCEFGTCAECVS